VTSEAYLTGVPNKVTKVPASPITCGTHQGILLFRLAKEGQNAITSVLEWILEHHEIETWKGSLVVASAHQLRIRRP